MDPSIFEVAHPVVLPGDRPGSSMWTQDHPAALLVTALSGPGVRVLAAGLPDQRLPLLAALLGARVAVLTDDADEVLHAARLNDVEVGTVLAWPPEADLVIAPDATFPEVAGAVTLCWYPVEPPVGMVRIDVVAGDVTLGRTVTSSVPHLVVPSGRAEDVAIMVKRALEAQRRRHGAGLADHAAASALRLAAHVQDEAQRDRETAAAAVARAYEQMQQARDELRGIRASRSWRYTRSLRRVTDR